MLHHAFVPTHPEPTSQRYITKPQTVRFSSHTPVWNFAETDYTSHVCQPWTNVSNIRHKTSDPKIFISHIPLLSFAGAALHITPRMCADPSWTYLPRIHHKTSDRKIFISHTCLELCWSSSPCYTTHVSQPILNQRPKTHYKLQSRKGSSHTSLFWTLPEQITPRMCANPGPMLQRYTTKPQTTRFSSHTSLFWTLPEQLSILHHTCEPTHPEPTSQDTLQTSIRKFSSHTCCFELCRNNSEQMTPRMCANPEPPFQRYTTKPQTLRFSSHTSVWNFAGTALHVTPRTWANPSWTNVPRHTTNFRSENFHLTHSCFELCRNRLHLACVPTLNQCGIGTPQNLRPQHFHLTHPSFELCRNRLHLACVPTLNQCGKDTPQNLRPQDFHLTHPCFELCRNNSEQMTPRMCAHPEPPFQRYTTKP